MKQSSFDKIIELQNLSLPFEKELQDRFFYIADKIRSTFKEAPITYIHFEGNYNSNFDIQDLIVQVSHRRALAFNAYPIPEKDLFAMINNQTWKLQDGFPVRWIFDENFEQELIAGIEAYKLSTIL